MQKSADLLVASCVLFLSYSLAQLASAVATFGLKPCYKIDFPSTSVSSKKEKLISSLEKPGFFSSGEKKVEEVREVESQGEEVYSLDNYVLKGTIVCSQCEHSIAILKEKKSGKSLTVTSGQKVDGFRVVAVYPDRVVLKGKGRTVVLKLFEKKFNRSSSLLDSKQGERNVFKVERREIIDEISSGNFLKYISIIPWKNPEGLKVTYVNRRSFIYKLGLRPGDVITSINDVHIKTPEDSFSAFEQLKNSDTVTITVVRHGREIKLHYELE
ncbi:PDZ domain-containing protein [Phorcysia thermohydrogeniphila]|uniref:Type II secretion system protein C (GspC) n=1 Tax=Phorcysia thermohydrogeniphila TaxID=936138 RepID=A0A4R1GHG7_9BACT|nr:PDZ domain-containing protein [Phorcysia thermohydrogeniphila]TCK06483.1 type II secretion system protein C (GspC) [Phorcysia thermohydrogeniphila]